VKIAAVIFDLDGTVLANEDEYGAAFATVLRELGAKVTSKYPHVGGIGVKENWPGLLKKYKIKTKKSLDELTRKTQREYLEQLSHVYPKDGFEVFIKDLKGSDIPIALATSNEWFMLEKTFEKIPIEKYFDVITTGDEVASKKPAPDLFLETAEKLGVEPSECLVFEDSGSGIEAANKAGMRAIAIARDDEHAKSLEKASLVIRSYWEVSPELLWRL
jgi:HAD superfamily hydrolase (TIGR01509 family)